MRAQTCPTLCDPMNYSPPASRPWSSPGGNTGVGCWAVLQGIFLTLGSKPASFASPALAGGFFTTAPYGKPQCQPNRGSLRVKWKYIGKDLEQRLTCGWKPQGLLLLVFFNFPRSAWFPKGFCEPGLGSELLQECSWPFSDPWRNQSCTWIPNDF